MAASCSDFDLARLLNLNDADSQELQLALDRCIGQRNPEDFDSDEESLLFTGE